jgi:hypothetical protein
MPSSLSYRETFQRPYSKINYEKLADMTINLIQNNVIFFMLRLRKLIRRMHLMLMFHIWKTYQSL